MTARLVLSDGEFPPATLDARAARLAGGLARLGVDDGDVIAALLRNDLPFVDVIRACRIAGCFYCPINWHFKADEVGFILRDCGAKVLIAHADLLEPVAAAVPPGVHVLVVDGSPPQADYARWLDAQAPYDGAPRYPRAHMAYTSGTTGRPKGVRRGVVPPERRAEQQALARDVVAQSFGITDGVRALLSAPLYHSAPTLFAQQALELGELLVLEPRFDAERTLALIERHRIQTVYLVPIMYVRLLRLPADVRARHDLSSVRFVASTGAPCAPDVKRAMLDWWGPVIYETYASSETGMLTVQDPGSTLRKPGSAGRPLGRAEIRILRDDGTECATGEPGVIYARQPATADFTYVGDDAARAAVGRGDLVTVGDIGYVDADGYLFLCDRASDMVISGGVNIYPAEIEHALMSLAGVADCAVFGVPDDEYGEALAALVLPAPGAAPSVEQLRAHLAERIAGYKVPRRIELVTELPRDDNGKVAKRRLRDAYWASRERRI